MEGDRHETGEGLPIRDITYAVYLVRFGLTPEQVDALPLGVERLVFPVLKILGESSGDQH